MGIGKLEENAGRTIVVWDFDWSLINHDSDDTLIKGIGAHHIFESYRKGGTEWNQSVDLTLLAAHQDLGISEQEAVATLETLPLEESTKEVIRSLHSLKSCDQMILSDANSVSIRSVLKRHDLENCFVDIRTNPAEFRDGALRVSPYHKSNHGCTTLNGSACPPNMCKGKVLEGFLKENPYEMVVYVGDGQGDFCACTCLGPNDLIFARKVYPEAARKTFHECALLRLLKSNGAQIVSDEKQKSTLFKSGSTGNLRGVLGAKHRARSDRIVSQVVPWLNPDDLADCLSELARGWSSA